MKLKFTPVVVAITILLVACSGSKSTSSKYPYPGSPYPQESKKEGDGSASEKNSNAAHPSNLPPGQAKKIYGAKSARDFAPGQQKKHKSYYPLIIVKTPDIVIMRHVDGRYFYRNADNYVYWKGSDERFYLDEQYLSKVQYDTDEYEEWRGKGNVSENKIPPGQQKKNDDDDSNSQGKEKKKSKKD